MKLTIDRWEGEFAVCEKEDGLMVRIPRDALPKEAKEGDALQLEEEKFTVIANDRAARIKKKMEGLWH